MVRSKGIEEILRGQPDPTAAANALVDAANAAGGEDNITVVVLDAVAEAKDPLPSSVAAAIRAKSTGTPASAPIEVVETTTVGVTTTTTSIDAPAAEVSSPPSTADTSKPPRDTAKFREPPKDRRGSRTVLRVLAFVVPILVIVGAGLAALAWYANNSYFAAFHDGKVVVYRGREGGVLLWDPHVVVRTPLTRDQLTQFDKDAVDKHPTFSTEADARVFVNRVEKHATDATTTTTSTTTLPTTPTSATIAPVVAPTATSAP
jgi:hypothetical protein